MRISVRDLSHIYKLKNGEIEALQEISFSVESGEFVALIGPSGCGKSTILRILANLLLPTSGEVLIGNKSPSEARKAKQVGWLAQNPALLPWKTVEDNISIAQQINPQNGRTLPTATDLLRLVDLEEFAGTFPFALSGGMAQRAALARTLATGAEVWLMDEPFAALDEITREMLSFKLIHIWAKFQPTVLWITHSVYEAVRLADRVLVMSPRPGMLSSQIKIDMPRPRDETDRVFQEKIAQLHSYLIQYDKPRK